MTLSLLQRNLVWLKMKNKKILENTDGNKKSGIFYSKRREGMGGGRVGGLLAGSVGFQGDQRVISRCQQSLKGGLWNIDCHEGDHWMPLNTELKEGGGSQVKFNVTHQKSSDPPPRSGD